jgi:hypothetical protein
MPHAASPTPGGLADGGCFAIVSPQTPRNQVEVRFVATKCLAKLVSVGCTCGEKPCGPEEEQVPERVRALSAATSSKERAFADGRSQFER